MRLHCFDGAAPERKQERLLDTAQFDGMNYGHYFNSSRFFAGSGDTLNTASPYLAYSQMRWR